MPDFPTAQDLFRIARDEVLVKNSALTRAIVERAGSDANALTAAGVAIGDAIVGQLIRVNADLFMATARKDALTRLIFDRYQLPRKEATPAVGEVTFSLPAPAASAFTIPADTQLRTQDGKLFLTTVERTFPAGAASLAGVVVVSSLAGLSQAARAGTITSLISSIAGAPAGLTVNNPLATAGSSDEEGDEAYRARGQLFYKTARRGTLAAIRAGALAVPGVRTASVFEALEADATPARLVEVVVADEFTEQLVDVTTTPPTYVAQAQALRADVLSALEDVRAAGIQVVVTIANVRLLGVTLGLRFRAGADVQAASSAAKAVIVAYTNALAPGATFVVADALVQLSTVPGLVVTGSEILAPTLDETALPHVVLRTTAALVTVLGVS